MAQENNKKKAIESAVTQIEKQFGKGSIMRLGGEYTMPDISVIPTGSISLDHALGIGGVPRGRVVEIYGPESSGKTTLALQIVAEAQNTGGVASWMTMAGAMSLTQIYFSVQLCRSVREGNRKLRSWQLLSCNHRLRRATRLSISSAEASPANPNDGALYLPSRKLRQTLY